MAGDEIQLKRSKKFWPRLTQAAVDELQPLLSRRVLATLAFGIPVQSFSRTRTALLRASGMRVGPRSLCQGPVRITGSDRACELLEIGADTLISGALHCDLGAPIRIGERVRIGHDVSLLTVDHEIGTSELRCGTKNFGAIEIGDGAWLASRVVVLPGVRIGAGAIIAAGSVVTRDVEANTLVAGAPARKIRDLSDASCAESQSSTGDEPPSSRRLRLA
jgi:acetyltransferase-like isoleucine patch superfamily enzyme